MLHRRMLATAPCSWGRVQRICGGCSCRPESKPLFHSRNQEAKTIHGGRNVLRGVRQVYGCRGGMFHTSQFCRQPGVQRLQQASRLVGRERKTDPVCLDRRTLFQVDFPLVGPVLAPQPNHLATQNGLNGLECFPAAGQPDAATPDPRRRRDHSEDRRDDHLPVNVVSCQTAAWPAGGYGGVFPFRGTEGRLPSDPAFRDRRCRYLRPVAGLAVPRPPLPNGGERMRPGFHRRPLKGGVGAAARDRLPCGFCPANSEVERRERIRIGRERSSETPLEQAAVSRPVR